MAVSARQVQVALVAYIDSLMGKTLDYGTWDCTHLVRGWIPDLPDPGHTAGDWARRMADAGGRDWHLGLDAHLPRRCGPARVGDIVVRRDLDGLACLGIARDRLTGYFLVVSRTPGGSPAVLCSLDPTLPVWQGRMP